MTDPHIGPLIVDKRAETRFTRIYLAYAEGTHEYSLHVRVGAHGLHEGETLRNNFGLDFSANCPLNGNGCCYWRGLGTKKTPDAAAIIEAIFDRYRRHMDRALELAWDWRCVMRDIGHPEGYPFYEGDES